MARGIEMRNFHEIKGEAAFFSVIFSLVVVSFALIYLWVVNSKIKGAKVTWEDMTQSLKVHSVYNDLMFLLLTGTQSNMTIQSRFTSDEISDEKIYLDGRTVKTKVRNVSFSVQDTNGLISIRAPERIAFRRLLKQFMDEKQVRIFWDSLLDWEDKNDFKRLNGAEKQYYESEKELGYHPRNCKIIYKKELTLIRGMDEDVFRKLSPFITIYTHSGFNPNTAPAPVLEARLNIDGLIAEKIIERREEEPLKSDTEMTDLGVPKPIKKGREVWYFPDPLLEIKVFSKGKIYHQRRCVVYLKESKVAPFAVYEWEE